MTAITRDKPFIVGNKHDAHVIAYLFAPERLNPKNYPDLLNREAITFDAETKGVWEENANNGRNIDWDYWIGKMPTITSQQAARLMCALDPDLFADLNSRPNKNDPANKCKLARDIERLARAAGIGTATPEKWIEWADSNGYGQRVHWQFRAAVEAKPKVAPVATPEPATQPQAGIVEAAPVVKVPAWTLTKPKRLPGYRRPIYLLLQAAHSAKQSRPTAREVIDSFAASKPDEIAQILPNGFDYYDAKGNTKGATLAAISESIRRMTA